jgi:amino acid adenylation domain-containing protein/thioester reductase-like protein
MVSSPTCLHHFFKAQAEKTPTRPAVVSREDEKDYSELDRESDALSGYLRQHGVSLDDRVGIFMGPCAAYIVACIGVLKAGGAFMPLALESPGNLLKNILGMSKPKVIITTEHHSKRLIFSPNTHVLLIDTDRTWREISAETRYPVISRHNLAFVPYTSGTTGDPKGVMQTHEGMLSSYFGRYNFSSYQIENRVACNIFFAWEFLRPLLNGGTVYVIPDDVVFLPRALLKYISENEITEVLLTPSLLQGILNSADADVIRADFKSLQVVWLNGEVVSGSLKEQALAVLPISARLFNTYSISEAHDVCTVELKSSPSEDPEICPVGLPMVGVKVMVLPAGGHDLATDGTGELYIGGLGLARGYLEMADMNQQKFVHVNGERYYASGDLAEIDPRGAVTVIGRNDSMVKIRGYTVYLGGIEEILKKNCDVLDAAVTVEGDDPNNRWLLAYVSRKPESTWRVDAGSATSKDLRNLLERYLPHYMVPNRYVEIEKLPIDKRTGKMDSKALPVPRKTKSRNPDMKIAAKDAPSPSGRKVMMELWGEALGIDASALNGDWDFFDIGGNSLSALGLTLGVEQTFGVKLQGTEVYEYRSINELVTYLAYGGSAVKPEFSLANDALLDPNLSPATTSKGICLSEASNIFVTGATGFLGSFLLDELLRSTGQETIFYCLARNQATQHRNSPNNRVLETLKFYGLPAQSLRERIVTVTGDLTQERFGLTEEKYLQLAGKVDLVFHCAASVNYSYPYNLIKPHTIDGTTEVIRFACHTKTKTVQYVSSNGVFPGGDDVPYQENNNIDAFADRMEGGYNQAKWVAERLMWYASIRGVPICVFRPGNIGHHSITGVVNPNDFQTLIIKACLRIGSAPIAPSWLFEMTPVDFLATAFTKIADDPSHFGKVYNIVQQDPVPADFVFTHMRANGNVAELVPLTDWKSRLQETADNSDDLELKLLAQSLDSVEGYLTDTSVYDISRFSEAMSQSRLKPPVVDVDYVTMFLRSL